MQLECQWAAEQSAIINPTVLSMSEQVRNLGRAPVAGCGWPNSTTGGGFRPEIDPGQVIPVFAQLPPRGLRLEAEHSHATFVCPRGFNYR